MSGRSMLELRPEAWQVIVSQATSRYPTECCGLMLGKNGDETREIVRAMPAPNTHADGPRTRFLISPDTFLQTERAAAAEGLSVLGVYHSHPDVAARPSRFDLESAWPWYSYLIVAVAGGRAAEACCWRLAEDRAKFNSEPVVWLDSKGRYVDPSLDSDAIALLRRPTGER